MNDIVKRAHVLKHSHKRCVIGAFDKILHEVFIWTGHRAVLLFILHKSVFRLVGLKEYKLGTQSLGLDWPLSEVGTGLDQQTCLSPHHLIIWACLTAWRPRTNNNIDAIMLKSTILTILAK